MKEPKSGKVRVNSLHEDTILALRTHKAKQSRPVPPFAKRERG
jgi:hypothetical protein